MPEATLRAFADHGDPSPSSAMTATAAEDILRDAARAGLDLQAITVELERDGIRSFCDSYQAILDHLGTRIDDAVLDHRTVTSAGTSRED
jgi:transaldolase